MRYMLSVQDLSCGILKNITFSFDKNNIVSILGKCGSGKTTLLKCISGLLKYNGNIYIQDNCVDNELFINRNVGIFIGTSNLNDETVYSNLIEPLNNLDVEITKSKKIVSNLSKKIGIEDLLYKNINGLSYAQKKVVAFAKSVIHEPAIVLLDNIFDTLDLYYKNKICEYLRSLSKDQDCIIIFTTSKSEDLMFADNIIILNNGILVANNTKKELFKNETLFNKNGVKLPFVIDLSHKLKSYDLIDKIVYTSQEMVDELWK